MRDIFRCSVDQIRGPALAFRRYAKSTFALGGVHMGGRLILIVDSWLGKDAGRRIRDAAGRSKLGDRGDGRCAGEGNSPVSAVRFGGASRTSRSRRNEAIAPYLTQRRHVDIC